jgi:ABC-type transporter Mla subunit MlaD
MGIEDLTPQLRTRLRRVERLVGVFVGLAVFGLIGGFAWYFYQTAVRKGWFVAKAPYYTLLHSAEGVNVGDPVTLAGFTVGEVTTIEAEPPGAERPVFLGFRIRRPYYGYVWSDSQVKIVPAELFGGRRLEVTTGFDGSPTVREEDDRVDAMLVGGKYVKVEDVPKGAFVPPAEQPALTERAEKLLAQVEEALPRILALADDAHGVLANAEQASARLDDVLRQVEPAAADLAAITRRLRDPHGSLGDWLLSPAMRRDLEATLASTHAQLETLAPRLDETLANLARMTATLNRQVQGNDQVVSEISRLAVEAEDLVQGLKRHWLLRSAFPREDVGPPAPLLEPEIAPPAGP